MNDRTCPDISARCNEMTSFLVMDVLEAAHRLEREGHDVIHLEIRRTPISTPPECVKEAACRALAENKTHYTHSLGIIELREAICEDYLNRYGVEIHPDQIIVTQGTSPAMFMLFSTLLERGDKVVVSDPCYACYSNFIRFPGGIPLPVRVHEDGRIPVPSRGHTGTTPPKPQGRAHQLPGQPHGHPAFRRTHAGHCRHGPRQRPLDRFR